jgi:acyl-CoA synthetase (NDP forming)
MLSAYGRRRGGLAVLSTSGAGAALLADIAYRHGTIVPKFQPATQQALSEIDSFSHATNPLDLGIFQGSPRENDVCEIVAADSDIGALVVLTPSFHGLPKHPLIWSTAKARKASKKPIIVVAPGGLPPEERNAYQAGDVRVLRYTEAAMEGLATVLRAELQLEPGAVSADDRRPPLQLARGRVYQEFESLELLAEHGILTVATHKVSNEDELLNTAERLGWPIVLKGVMEGIAHKTEHGLVRVGIGTREELIAAYRDMGCRYATVQPLEKGKLELIAGVARVPRLGLFLLAGLGGIFAEALGEVLLWPIPTSKGHVQHGLINSVVGRIAKSPRWGDSDSIDAFMNLLMTLQRFAEKAGDSLEAVDINPVILGSGRAIAVDALIMAASLETSEE